MNTDILLAAEGRADRVQQGFDHAEGLVHAYEAQFTRFSDHSELYRLNSATARWFRVSPDMLEILLLAREYADATGGLFNPAILPALVGAGYDRSMDEIKLDGPGPARVATGWDTLDIRDVRFDVPGRRVWLPPGMQIDLGGIAKGWIAGRVAEALAQYAHACAVDAGGDISLQGRRAGRGKWEVAIENPARPEEDLALLAVASGGVATSSVMKRRWEQEGELRHHLIDPRTGEPAETDWQSVTVIAPNVTAAEVYAKALLIAGSQAGPALVQDRNEFAFIAVDFDGQLWGSTNSQEFLDVRQALVA